MKRSILSAIIAGLFVSSNYTFAATVDYSLKDVDYISQPRLLDNINFAGSSLKGKSITLRYRKDGAGLSSLLSFSDKNKTTDYIALYAMNNVIGIEQQTNGDTPDKTQKHVTANVTPEEGFNTVTYSFSEQGEMQVYFNGIKAVTTNKTRGDAIFDRIPENYTNIKLGALDRIDTRTQSLSQGWTFNGDIYVLEVGSALDDIAAKRLHENLKTMHEQELASPFARNPLTMGVKDFAPTALFDAGYADNIPYWRIPSLLRTQDGVLIAAADKHYQNTWDWGAIHTAYRTSRDDGKTWEDIQTLMGLATHHNERPPLYTENPKKFTLREIASNSAFLIDAVMVQDKNSNRLFLGIDMFPESLGLFRSGEEKNGNGHVKIGDKYYLKLHRSDGTVWTLRDAGEVYNELGEKTEYRVTVSGTQEQHFKQLGDVYKGTEKLGNIYLQAYGQNENAPFVAQATSYFWITHSDDNGKTWSSPTDITAQIKKDWMRFLGTGPGVGIQTKNGNLIMPVYYTNRNNAQSSALIISKDGGKTWDLGASPNDSRFPNSTKNSQTLTGGADELTESQVVELDNGDLKLFMRNMSGKVRVATSKDGGYTWLPMEQRIDLDGIQDSKVKELNNPYSQLSVIKYSKKINGKEYLIFSGPSVSASGGAQNRRDGKIFLGEVQDSGEIKWFTDSYKAIESADSANGYVYSSLAELGDGSLGLLYENSIEHTTIVFQPLDMQQLFWKQNKIFSDIREKSPRIFTYTGNKHIEKIGDGTAIKQGVGESLGGITVSEGILVLNQQADDKHKNLAFTDVILNNNGILRVAGQQNIATLDVSDNATGYIEFDISDAETATLTVAEAMKASALDVKVNLLKKLKPSDAKLYGQQGEALLNYSRAESATNIQLTDKEIVQGLYIYTLATVEKPTLFRSVERDYSVYLTNKLITEDGKAAPTFVASSTIAPVARPQVNPVLASYLTANIAMGNMSEQIQRYFEQEAQGLSDKNRSLFVKYLNGKQKYASDLAFVDYGYTFNTDYNGVMLGGKLWQSADLNSAFYLAANKTSYRVTPQAADGESKAKYQSWGGSANWHITLTDNLAMDVLGGYQLHQAKVENGESIKGRSLNIGSNLGYQIKLQDNFLLVPTVGLHYLRTDISDIIDQAHDTQLRYHKFAALKTHLGIDLNYKSTGYELKGQIAYAIYHQKQGRLYVDDIAYKQGKLANALNVGTQLKVNITPALSLTTDLGYQTARSQSQYTWGVGLNYQF
ncbi:exo-alpha-sialidase [Testudinibacter aquarius]|uniref:exo-alpha-sialidase n=1 Tax=Testudinibacter aquarius TaxID=1524974 RepID=A0A4R3Y7Q4_9PAST|nr:exo-alpha-sialidase [Testudinibacter aquarius]KAE9525517.1 hypothetical protein A1D24_04350 [Testudinibacter aquarius]TCV87907.1 sialidase-1 [Testudinibacter aquarius]TNG89697.1 autotransporter domain-containing protein [Testudinibacter aquarius]